MTHAELLQLRRKARRSDKVRPSAALLFAEICDFHELPEGCKVSNEGFAQRLDCTTRSVRNWINELVSCGLVSETKEGGNRYLEPRNPSWVELDTDQQDRKKDSAAENSFRDGSNIPKDASSDRKSRSVKTGKSFPPQKDNITAYAEESAPARGDGISSTTEDRFEELVTIWREVSTTPPLTENAEDVLWSWAKDAVVTDYDRFRRILQQDASSVKGKGSGFDFGVLLDKLEQAQSPDNGGHQISQVPNPNGIRDSNGRHLRRTPEFVN